MRRLRRLEVTPRLIAIVLAGALTLGVGGGALAVAVTSVVRGKNEERNVERVVLASARGFESISRRAGSVQRVADVQALGKAARSQLESTRDGMTQLRAVNVDLAMPAAALLAAQADLLSIYASTERLATPRRQDVDRVERSLRSAERSHAVAVEQARRADLGVGMDSGAVEINNKKTVELLRRAATKLAAWQRRVATIRAGRRERILVINAYEKTFRSHTSTYDAARTSLSDWIEHVDSDGATFDEAYEFLADAAREREVASAAVQSIRPPAAVRAQHGAVVSSIARAREAVQSATQGVADYQFDFDGEYETYKDTPGWRAFRSESRSVATQYEAAIAEWQRRLDALRNGLRSAPLPQHPKV